MSDNSMTTRERNKIVSALRSDPNFNSFRDVLAADIINLREIYEASPASEYNRGKLNGVKAVLDTLTKGE